MDRVRGFEITQWSQVSEPHDEFKITLINYLRSILAELLGLLRWREPDTNIAQVLENFLSIDKNEVVRFLQDALDSLFGILMECSNLDSFDSLVFQCLVSYVFSLFNWIFVITFFDFQRKKKKKTIIFWYIHRTRGLFELSPTLNLKTVYCLFSNVSPPLTKILGLNIPVCVSEFLLESCFLISFVII